MDKIIEALSKLLPEEQVKDVAAAVEEMLNEAKAELEGEFNNNLEKAYADMSGELKTAEGTAQEGYQQAWGVITDLRTRLESQKTEFDSALEEGYEEAYQMLLAERGKNDGIETDLYEEYDKKLAEMKDFMIDKLDEFLQQKGTEIYEQARRDVVNDPRMVGHKVTLDRVIDTVTDYISDDDYSAITSSKLSDASKKIDELEGRNRILEAKNIRVSTENNKLNEQVRSQAEVITEAEVTSEEADKKERIEKAEKATGRGRQVTESVEVIAEGDDATPETDEGDTTLVEALEETTMDAWKVLSGLKESE